MVSSELSQSAYDFPAPWLTGVALTVVELSRTESTSGQMATFNSSMSRRPSSIKPSMRSSRSRITLVGYDEDLDYRPDTPYGTAHKVQFTWLDHLLGVFCMKRGSNTTLARTDMPRKPEEDEVRGSKVGNRGIVAHTISGYSVISVHCICLRSLKPKGRVETFHTQGGQMYD